MLKLIKLCFIFNNLLKCLKFLYIHYPILTKYSDFKNFYALK